jgi:hypothetical protein
VITFGTIPIVTGALFALVRHSPSVMDPMLTAPSGYFIP